MPGRTIPDWRPAGPPPRIALLIAIALVIGLGIASLDSRPGWDDTGITAALLVIGAAVVAAIDGRRPWLWTALVGGPLPILEVPATGSGAPLAGLLFAAIGASLGMVAHRALVAGRGRTA